jgi:molecular chaperone GrpE
MQYRPSRTAARHLYESIDDASVCGAALARRREEERGRCDARAARVQPETRPASSFPHWNWRRTMLRAASARLGASVMRWRAPLPAQRAAPGVAQMLLSTRPRPDPSQAPPEAMSDDSSAEDGAEPVGAATSDLAAELAEKDAAIAGLNDRVLRALAEMENVRSIARRDVANAREFGITSFARGLLDVADNLGLALHAVPRDRLEGDEVLRGLHEGVEATERELLKVLKQNGVERFGAAGDVFDPNRHQALFEAPSDEFEPGVVLDVAKTGYAIGDRLLRPAEVGVSKAAS